MSKRYRAVTKYRYTTKDNPDQFMVGSITTLIEEKSIEKLREKLLQQNKNYQEVSIITVEWKNWWGARH